MKMNNKVTVTGKSIDDYRRLISCLKREGYSLQGKLADFKDDDNVVAVMVDSENMVAYNTSVTVMACRATCGLKPVTVEDVICHFGERKTEYKG